MKTSPELQKAVAEYQKGSVEAFNTIYEQSYKYLHTCVIHVVKNEDMAMDMLQETYLEISKSISQLKSTEDFLSWAAMIANRKCFAHLKKQKDVLLDGSNLGGEGDLSDSVGDYFENIADSEEFIPETVLQDREKQRLIKEIIDGLNDMQRLCVIGFYYNEQKQEEIAEELGIPVNTVKSHLNRAKAKIKEAVVELDVKKGTRLYSVAPFMLLFLDLEAQACEKIPVEVLLGERFAQAGATAGTGTVGSIEAATKTTKLMTSLIKKRLIIAAIVTGSVAIVGSAVLLLSPKGKNEYLEVQQTEYTDTEEALQEMPLTKEPTISQEVEPVETPNAEAKEVEEPIVKQADISPIEISNEYRIIGYGNQGLIPAINKDEKYGLITYDNRIVVPFEYDNACEMVNEEGYSWFADEQGSYVFDREGNEIFSTQYSIASINEGVILVVEELWEGTVFSYYDMQGNLIYTNGTEPDIDAGAVGFNEGYAFFMDGETTRLFMDGSIECLADILYPPQPVKESNSRVVVNSTGDSFLLEIPIGAVKNGYYLERGIPASSDSAGIYTLRNASDYSAVIFDISCVFNEEGMSFSQENGYGGIVSYLDDGNYYMNNGTVLCVRLWKNGDEIYYLIDASKLEERTFEDFRASVTGSFSDEQYWDFDRTILTEEALLAKADDIRISDEEHWLIKQGAQFHFIDHAGNIVATYEGATEFVDGKALVKQDGMAYIIDNNFQVVNELGATRGISGYGELVKVSTKENIVGNVYLLNN